MSTKLASKSLSTLALIVLALLGLSTGNEFSEMPYKPDILDTDWHWESPDDTDHLQSRGGDALEDEEPFFSFGMIICKCFRFHVCTPLSDSPVTFILDILLVLCTIIVGIIVGKRIARLPIKNGPNADSGKGNRFPLRKLNNLSTSHSSASSTDSRL